MPMGNILRKMENSFLNLENANYCFKIILKTLKTNRFSARKIQKIFSTRKSVIRVDKPVSLAF